MNTIGLGEEAGEGREHTGIVMFSIYKKSQTDRESARKNLDDL